MKLSEIETPVSSLAGVGPATAAQLARLAVHTIGDLLASYPKSWDDRTKRVSLCEFKHERVHTFVQIIGHEWFGSGRARTLKLLITDGTAEAELIAFNRPFLEKSFPVLSIASLTGVFGVKYGRIQCTAFDLILVAESGRLSDYERIPLPDAAILPVYALTAGLNQGTMRKIMRRALSEYGRGLETEIPPDVLMRRGLMKKTEAVHAMHLPKTAAEAEAAKKTLIYEELYRFQLAVARRSLEHKGSLPAADMDSEEGEETSEDLGAGFEAGLSPRQKILFAALPFRLTADQLRAVQAMNDDIDRGYRSRAAALKSGGGRVYTMARLIQGDVGSGKTLAALFVCLRVADWGGQCAVLAPTEILARQHADTASKLLAPCNMSIAFLTGNLKAEGRSPLLKGLREGSVDLVIGTHALFSKNVQYKDLQLAVIDEQHRFGVLQCNAIIEKGRKDFAPHLLMMSATPIPRTLALTVFGDLDVSVIKTMPQGRKPIKTYLTRMGNEERVYDFVEREIAQGHQAYFVYPLIEGEEGGLKTAEDMFVFLQKRYPRFRLFLVHSRVDEAERYRALEEFRAGRIDILVATSVVEVGVDAPRATCMVIEHADRFGLAALHQLRGRVGRGSLQSYCFPVYSAHISDTGKERMRALYETTDGFKIAEEDLRLRGAGEVAGIQQSGYFTIGLADPLRDQKILMEAREDAFAHAALMSDKALAD